MNVVCFGDSNTYGYDPRSFFGDRYDAHCRWVDLLAAKTGWEIRNEGENGRQIPRTEALLPEDVDLLIVMLGTNDLLQGNSVEAIARRMELFLCGIRKEKLLLIAPPPMKPGEWVTSQSLIEASKQLAVAYESLSKRLGIRFADAGAWNVGIAFDGVHFTQDGHKAFSEGLLTALTDLL